MADAWGGSWGSPSAWGVSWGGTDPIVVVTPAPPPASSGVGGGGGRGNFGDAWEREWTRKKDRLARLSGELPRKKDQKAVEKAVRTINEAVNRIAEENPAYYSERLNGALGEAVEAKGPQQIVQLSKAAAEAAELALLEMIEAANEDLPPPKYEMTDWDRAAILLLS